VAQALECRGTWIMLGDSHKLSASLAADHWMIEFQFNLKTLSSNVLIASSVARVAFAE
jgi:hypothetical protein